MLLFALLWAIVVEFVSRYLMYKRQPPFLAAPQWVEQILHHLLLNAIQAQQSNAPKSAWVEIAARPTKKGITLTLTDGGPRLSEQALQHVFLPFHHPTGRIRARDGADPNLGSGS